MLEDRPHLFAASLLFAPDYDPSKVAALATAKMWIVVSQGDEPSYNSMNASLAALKAAGAHVGEAVWKGDSSQLQFTADVHKLEQRGDTTYYAILKKGTVVPASLPDDAVDNHAYAWRIGYSIAALRDWLFTQKIQQAVASR